MKQAGGHASSGLLVWAVMSGETGEIGVSDHFREVTKMMTAGKGAQRAVKDYVLTRFVLQQIFV